VGPPFRIVLIVLFLATLARAVAFAGALPAWQGPDEPAHYAYVERLATGGSQPIGAGPAEFDAHIKREIERWNKVLKTAGIKLN